MTVYVAKRSNTTKWCRRSESHRLELRMLSWERSVVFRMSEPPHRCCVRRSERPANVHRALQWNGLTSWNANKSLEKETSVYKVHCPVLENGTVILIKGQQIIYPETYKLIRTINIICHIFVLKWLGFICGYTSLTTLNFLVPRVYTYSIKTIYTIFKGYPRDRYIFWNSEIRMLWYKNNIYETRNFQNEF